MPNVYKCTFTCLWFPLLQDRIWLAGNKAIVISLGYLYRCSYSLYVLLLPQIDAKEAAQVFEQFVASFEGPGKTGKTFVRGSTINPESSSSECVCVCVGGGGGCMRVCACDVRLLSAKKQLPLLIFQGGSCSDYIMSYLRHMLISYM